MQLQPAYIIAALIVIGVFVSFVITKKKQAKFEKLFTPALSKRGGQIHKSLLGKPEYHFDHNGAQCLIAVRHKNSMSDTKNTDNEYTSFSAFFEASQIPLLEIGPNHKHVLQSIALGMLPGNLQPIKTNEPVFDDLYTVCGENGGSFEQLLSPEIRNKLIELKDFGPSLSLAQANLAMAGFMLKQINLPDGNLGFLTLNMPGVPEESAHIETLIESGLFFLERTMKSLL